MTTDTTTAWPEGVIARYLTVGGATIDVIDKGDGHYPAWRYEMACRGCPDELSDSHESLIRRRAQEHAETCRAMPCPA